MKRHRSSSSVAGGQESYGERLPSILDGVEEEEEEELYLGGVSAPIGEKKRRLSVEQVKALEKNFEVENKLDPERKVRIAHDLGLQPRQVAVWFQNRRARWKNKQLERDYAALRSSFDALAADCNSLRRDKEALLVEIEGLKAKLGATEEEEMESKAVALEDPQRAVAVAAATAAYKDGSSDSDSSAVVCDANSPHQCNIPLPSELHRRPEEMQSLVLDGGFDFHHGSDWRVQRSLFSKEEQGFLGGEEHCSVFFSEEQNPSFAWYCADHWS